MKRRALLTSIAATSVVGVAGCSSVLGSNPTDTATPKPEEPKEVVRVFFKTRNIHTRADQVHPDSDTYDYVFVREDAADDPNYLEPARVKELETLEKGQSEAVVQISYESNTCEREGSDCQTYVSNITLRKTDDNWKLYDSEEISGYPDPPTPVQTGTTTE